MICGSSPTGVGTLQWAGVMVGTDTTGANHGEVGGIFNSSTHNVVGAFDATKR